jgi:hypothetical protein
LLEGSDGDGFVVEHGENESVGRQSLELAMLHE